MLFGSLISMAVAGFLLLVVGLRGRRVGRDWHCRRCGYCLAGIEELGVCPECEARVSDPVCRVVGRRVRRRRVAWVGAALLAIGGPGVVAMLVVSPPGSNPYAWMPDWLLVRQGPDDGINGYWFRQEVLARLKDGRLTAEQRLGLAARAKRRIEAQRWEPDAPGIGAALEWAPIYGALWQYEVVSDSDLATALSESVLVRIGLAPVAGAPAWTVHVDMRGALNLASAGWHGGTGRQLLMDGEVANVSDYTESTINDYSSYDAWTAADEATVSRGFEIRLVRSFGSNIATAYAAGRSWVIVIEVPAAEFGGSEGRDVVVRHEIVEGNPYDAARARDVARHNAEFAERLRQQYERRSGAP